MSRRLAAVSAAAILGITFGLPAILSHTSGSETTAVVAGGSMPCCRGFQALLPIEATNATRTLDVTNYSIIRSRP
ncbi:MAG: hypothetical protein QG622_1694 [Actinomycetota bacterium]|nr:hypothetical protein [Actinomycetota bacterium]